MCRTMSMFWVIYKWQIVLICISYIGFGKSTGWYYKDTSRASTTSKFEYCKKKIKIKKKEDEIQAFPNPFFPLFGQNWRLSKNMRRYRHNSVHIQENTD